MSLRTLGYAANHRSAPLQPFEFDRREPGPHDVQIDIRYIASDIELIPIQQIGEAYERTLRSDVRYRFVIDMASLRAEGA